MITVTQAKILANIAAGVDYAEGRPEGRSTAGGWSGSYTACLSRGWIEGSRIECTERLTPLGQEMLDACE